MSKIYTFGNTKGGVGKSTIAVQVALGLAARGHNVWFVDGDEQGTGIDAITVRSSRGDAHPAAANYDKGETLRAQVKRQADNYDFTIIDAGGRDNGPLRAAITLSSALIVPIKPRSFETWALPKLDSLIREVLAMRDDLEVYALLNEADPSGSDNEEAIEAVTEFPYLKPLVLQIGRRKVIGAASAAGRYIDEVRSSEPSTIAAMAELSTLVSMVENHRFDIRSMES
jgi:chromosome partitioning protein